MGGKANLGESGSKAGWSGYAANRVFYHLCQALKSGFIGILILLTGECWAQYKSRQADDDRN